MSMSVRFGGLQLCPAGQPTGIDGYRLAVSLGTGGMALYDSTADPGLRPDGTVVLHIPRHRLPVPPDRVGHLLGIGLAGGAGVGSVLVGNLRHVFTLAEPISEYCANAVAGVVLDLLAAVLEERIALERPDALLSGVHAFVERRLPDPGLSLSQIAAAHHVSLRSLHKLFERSGTTAAAWIRQRRLEHCRLDLANPALERLPVHTIARRWGFVNDSHFNRAFRARFGLSPAAYRRRSP